MEYRINIFNQIRNFYSLVFSGDYDLKPTDISLYMFLLNQNNRSNWVEWFKCPFDLAMQGASISSKNTYYKCLENLKVCNLIEYEKGVNHFKAPKIKLTILKNDTLTDTLTVPLSEQVTDALTVPLSDILSDNIYRLITDNNKLLTDNYKEFVLFIENLKKPKETLNFHFDTENFKSQWKLWKVYKNKKHKFTYFDEESEQKALTELFNLSKQNEKTATLIIRQSIDKGWKGFFELKDEKPTPHPFVETRLKK